MNYGVKKTKKQSNDVSEIKYYKELLQMNENTADEIFNKYRQLAIENPDDFFFWNVLKLFIIEYKKENVEVDHKYQNMLAIIRNNVNYDKHIISQDNITVTGIQNNSKSYAVWNHRQYIYDFIDKERDCTLCQKLLLMDPRNFHCWNYLKANHYKIKQDLENISSLGYNMINKMIMIDTTNAGYWKQLLIKPIMESFFWVKIYSDRALVIFSKPFKGKFAFNKKTYLINNWSKILIIQDVIDESNLVLIEKPPILKVVLDLEPMNIYALECLLKFTDNHTERNNIKNKLKHLNPIRTHYYNNLEYYKLMKPRV